MEFLQLNSIYVVLLIAIIIFAGIVLTLIILNSKVRKLEKMAEDINPDEE